MRTPSRVVAKFVRRAALCLWLAPALVAAQDLARMEQLIRARVDDKSFMGTVLVARGDEVLLSKGYGIGQSRVGATEHAEPRGSGSAPSPSSSPRPRFCCSRSAASSRSKIPSRSTCPTRRLRGTRSPLFNLLTHTLGHSQLHELPRIQVDLKFAPSPPRRRSATFRDKPLDFAPGEKHELQQLGLRAARLPRSRRSAARVTPTSCATTSSSRSA